jgi:anthranilate synthase component I
LVSHIAGDLYNEYDCFDAFRSLFPAGTVSGAPKVRAMEVISELEKSARGPYAGALGYFSFNRCCDFAIIIRSLFINGNNAYIQSGAGIVMDSIPLNEYLETEHKAGALFSAMKAAKNQSQ